MKDLYDKVGEKVGSPEFLKEAGITNEADNCSSDCGVKLNNKKEVYASKEKRSAVQYSELEECSLEKHREDIEDRRQDRELRKNFAKIAFWFAVSSAAFFAFVIVWSGFSHYFCETNPFNDNVIVCVAGATTVNLFAAFLVITRGLFCVPKD